jgi:hypothetical protein
MLYLGPALDHSGDTHRMLNLQTERVINSRNVAWLGKSYGCWKGQEEAPIGENVSSVEWEERTPDSDGKSIPQTVSDDEEDPPDEPPPLLEQRNANEGEPAETDLPVEPSSRLLQEMARLSATYNQEAESLADRIRSVAQGTRSGGEQAANAFTMIDRFSGDFGMFYEFGMAMEDGSPDGIKPEEYTDHFQTPRTFKEAWDHPDPFQRTMWRDAIGKEFTKMNEKKVWHKIKREEMEPGRRCVKHKWVFEIKRNGRFRARLVACGYSQIPGVDFEQAYSAVANDVTFRIIIILMLVWKLSAIILDIETAFLYGKLDRKIYMDCPEGMEHEEDECVQSSLLQHILQDH